MNESETTSAWHVLARNAQRKCKGLEREVENLTRIIKELSKAIKNGDLCSGCGLRMKTERFVEGFLFKCTNENCKEGQVYLEFLKKVEELDKTRLENE